MPEPIFTKLGMYIMATESISTAYFINLSHHSVRVSFLLLKGNGSVKCFPLSVLGNGSVNTLPRQRIHRIVGCVCLWVCLCILLSLLGNSSVKTFPRQRRIVVGVVFYAIRVVLKDSVRSVLPRTCLYYNNTLKCHSRFDFARLLLVWQITLMKVAVL
jgi:hypothetical protein